MKNDINGLDREKEEELQTAAIYNIKGSFARSTEAALKEKALNGEAHATDKTIPAYVCIYWVSIC